VRLAADAGAVVLDHGRRRLYLASAERLHYRPPGTLGLGFGRPPALVVDALHHMPDHPAVFEELFRVLRPGGVVIVREFDPTTLPGRALAAAEHAWGFASTFHAPTDLADLLAAAGFEVSVVERGFGYTVVGVAGSGRHKSWRA